MTVQVSPEIQGRLSEMYGKLIYKYCIYKSVANISKRHLTISCFIVQRFLKNFKKKMNWFSVKKNQTTFSIAVMVKRKILNLKTTKETVTETSDYCFEKNMFVFLQYYKWLFSSNAET